MISDHIDLSLLDAGTLGEDLHVQPGHRADASVDQVLVADNRGYRVVNTFDTGTINNDPDIDPGQTATQMNGFTPNGTTSTRQHHRLRVGPWRGRQRAVRAGGRRNGFGQEPADHPAGGDASRRVSAWSR